MDWFRTIIETIALLFTAVQILLLTIQMRSSLNWEKNNNTFIEIDKLNRCIEQIDPVLVERIGLLKSDTKPIDRDVYVELMKNATYAKDLYLITYFYETFSVSVLSKRINENIAKRLLYVNITRAYDKLQPYINLRSETVGNGIHLCQHFFKLSNKWKDEQVKYKQGDYKDRRMKK